MKCENIKELLSAYLDDEVTADEKRDIEAHLVSCEECRDELQSLVDTREQLKKALKAKSNEVEPSAKTWELVRQRITPPVPFWKRFGYGINKPLSRMAIPALLILVVISVLFGTGVFSGWFDADKAATPVKTTSLEPPQRNSSSTTSASWVFGFFNLTDLCTYSDAVAIGVVDRVVETSQVNSEGYLFQTKWAFHVETMLKGAKTGELIVIQTGSPDKPGSDIKDDPLFLPGERYLLFLREATPGLYTNFGPCGRYLIWNEKVYSMDHIVLNSGYQAAPEIDFNGLKLDTLVAHIVSLVDSVQISLTIGKPRLPADVMRYAAGTTLYIDATLFTGKYGQGQVTYKVDSIEPGDGLKLNISPAEFNAKPRSEYKSTLVIQTFYALPAGSYRIRVKCDFADGRSAQRTITLYIDNR